MKLKTIAIIVLVIFRVTDTKGQNINDGTKITKATSNSAENYRYAMVEIVIKDKDDKKEINGYVIQFDKVGVLVNDDRGYSKFFIKPGKYDILIKVVGYNDKLLKGFKLSKGSYKIEIELEIKPERLN